MKKRSFEGYCRALLEEQATRLVPQGIDYLRRIGNACLRIQELIDGIPNPSRVSRSELHHERVEVGELANAVYTETLQREQEREVQCSMADGLMIEGDPFFCGYCCRTFSTMHGSLHPIEATPVLSMV